MRTLVIILLVFSCLSCSGTTNRGRAFKKANKDKTSARASEGKTNPADNAETRKRLKEQATDIANAVIAANFEKVADMTHPNCLEMMGGRATVIATQKRMREKTIALGGKITIERVDDPGDIIESHSALYSYVPVVARIHSQMPKRVLLMKSIFIGVSEDGGKNWKFVDDSGIPIKGSDKIWFGMGVVS